ncbi:MAG: hypothetical protein PUE08_03545 [Eubacteriales bacterium]|nr:hypothetical protein [Eubacteriales bacterium]
MKIVMTDIDGSTLCPKNITHLTMTDTADAACSSVALKFKDKERIGEINSVKVYDGDKAVFCGFCDCQRVTADGDGFECYIYARSSACLLVDSQAKPFTFNCPSARQLWCEYAKALGFSYSLPEYYCKEKYEISSGTSCFGAINNFVTALSGSEIYINAQNELCLRQESQDIKSLSKYDIISASSVINRSEPISKISFRREQDNGYNAHMESGFVIDKGISRERFVNLNSVASWQRDNTVYRRLKGYTQSYMLLEVTVAGHIDEELYQRYSFHGDIGDFDDYILTEKKYTFDGSRERTRLTLRKSIDIGDVMYVD